MSVVPKLVTNTLLQDANNREVQNPNGFTGRDATALTLTISNVALTSNVATITVASTTGLSVNQYVRITLNSADSDYAATSDLEGTYKVASIPGGTSFTFAKTHANISSAAITGTAVLGDAINTGQISPIASDTTEVALTFPGATGTRAAGVTLTFWLPSNSGTVREVSGGATGWVVPVLAAQIFRINGKPGDVVYIGRDGGASVLNFHFDTVG